MSQSIICFSKAVSNLQIFVQWKIENNTFNTFSMQKMRLLCESKPDPKRECGLFKDFQTSRSKKWLQNYNYNYTLIITLLLLLFLLSLLLCY